MSVNFKKDFHLPMLLFHVIKNFNFIREKFSNYYLKHRILTQGYHKTLLLLFINPLMSISFCFTGGSHVESVWESRHQKAQNAANCHQLFAQVYLIFYSCQPGKHGPSLQIGWRLLQIKKMFTTNFFYMYCNCNFFQNSFRTCFTIFQNIMDRRQISFIVMLSGIFVFYVEEVRQGSATKVRKSILC